MTGKPYRFPHANVHQWGTDLGGWLLFGLTQRMHQCPPEVRALRGNCVYAHPIPIDWRMPAVCLN